MIVVSNKTANFFEGSVVQIDRTLMNNYHEYI